MVMEGIQEDNMGDGSMLCTNHPYKNSSPGGICALCLQEKLGKLVSSSFPSAIFPSSSSSSTPSFRSDVGGPIITTTAPASSLPVQTLQRGRERSFNNPQFASFRKPRMPFQRRKKKSSSGVMSSSDASATVFKRSKSASTPRNRMNFLETDKNGEDYSPRKRGFWSFLYYSSTSSKRSTSKKTGNKDATFASPSASVSGSMVVRDKKRDSFVVVEENESSDEATAHDRKVSRSRSVGCGSRSFSGDFFERISTGFGDCTLRRVESQREGRPKIPSVHHRNSGASGQDCIRERVKCGGIFSGFMITSSSSSSSDWVSSEENVNGKATIPPASGEHHHQLPHGSKTKNWGWALASPMRAFSKPSTGKTTASNNKNPSPSLAAIPSLLTVRS